MTAQTTAGNVPRLLRQLAQPNAHVLTAPGMDKALIMRGMSDNSAKTVARVPRDVVLSAAKAGYLRAEERKGFSVYRLADDARSSIPRQMLAADLSPVAILARRGAGDGESWLSADLVRAAENLHHDYEVALSDPSGPDVDWTAEIDHPRAKRDPAGGYAARVLAALDALRDPELARLVFFVVCYQEGLETVEKRLCLPARSAKAVLRIGLRILAQHYRPIQ